MTILVTGGAGFVGSNFILHSFSVDDRSLINIDRLTYAGNPNNISPHVRPQKYKFVHGSIGDADLLKATLSRHSVQAIVNFAAESHVDRSISRPEVFFKTNVLDTGRLLDATKEYFRSLSV